MMLNPKEVLALVEDNARNLAINSEMIDIYENNLTDYVPKT